jgi:hypothetical protein
VNDGEGEPTDDLAMAPEGETGADGADTEAGAEERVVD